MKTSNTAKTTYRNLCEPKTIPVKNGSTNWARVACIYELTPKSRECEEFSLAGLELLVLETADGQTSFVIREQPGAGQQAGDVEATGAKVH